MKKVILLISLIWAIGVNAQDSPHYPEALYTDNISTITEDTLDVDSLTRFNNGLMIVDMAYPLTDGTSGQVLQTDGNGVLSFEDDASTPIANDANNRVTTATGSGSLNGEINLTFDGSTLKLGDITSQNLSVTGNSITQEGAAGTINTTISPKGNDAYVLVKGVYVGGNTTAYSSLTSANGLYLSGSSERVFIGGASAPSYILRRTGSTLVSTFNGASLSLEQLQSANDGFIINASLNASAYDAGSTPLLIRRVEDGQALSTINTRPLEAFYNYSTKIYEIAANGNFDFEANQLKDIQNPTDLQDAVTKAYLDGVADTLWGRSDTVNTLATQYYVDTEVAGVTTLVVSNEANNRVITSSGTNTGNAEENVTFDGSTLAIIGDITATDQIIGDEGQFDQITNEAGTDAPSVPYGIKFPETFSDNANVNTLDDYEDSTWTPAYSFTTSNGDLSHSIQVGRYVKVGKKVTLFGYVLGDETTASGNLTITGLPFPAANITNLIVGGGISLDNLTAIVGGVTYEITNGTSVIRLMYTGTGTQTAITNVNTTNNISARFSLTYYTD